MEPDNWDSLIVEVSELVTNRENYQRTLGKLASEVASTWGSERLNDFSRDLEESQGVHIAPSTLKNYRWVWDKTSNLDIPEDISYRTLQYIASSGNPELWAKRIIDEKLSSAEVYRLLREEKGLPAKKTTICPHCGGVI